MIKRILHYFRLYFYQAWFSYRSLFSWSTPFTYLTSKIGFPFFSMLFFVFMGKFVGFSDPMFIVVGNILMMPVTNGLYGLSMTIGNERQFGAMSYLLGSPAPRAPLFTGRAFFHILDGFITIVVALPIAMLLFKIDFSGINFMLLICCLALLAITTTGLGFIMGTISLLSRDGWMLTTTLGQLLYILIGVNIPIDKLPPTLQTISAYLPMTRGIQATRLALFGAGWENVAGLLLGELLVAVVYIIVGYTLFMYVERASMSTGSLDSI
ncbi:MAG: ABC transporter permease [Anaerolineaceae bacterium]|nr:ABC transporter permease [Anaerolineaceae bacterium]